MQNSESHVKFQKEIDVRKGKGVSFMTSEAKIGLLLGLVVIFIIALVVNGLPSFHKGDSTNDMTKDMVTLDNNPPVLAGGERQVSRDLGQSSSLQPLPVGAGVNQQTTSPDTTGVRSITPAPQAIGNQPQGITTLTTQGIPAGQNAMTSNNPSAAGTTTLSGLSNPPAGQAGNVIISGQPTVPAPQQGTLTQNPPAVKTELKAKPTTTQTKTYVVKSGDSLASIAVKCYGAKEGNKKANIDKIFNANKNVLKSVDEIYEGQKLVIPGISTSESAVSTTSSHSAAESNQGNRISASGEYVVADGDSLWKIAQAKLGNGTRYAEIIKLNSDVLKDGDNLSVGMKLRMPAK